MANAAKVLADRELFLFKCDLCAYRSSTCLPTFTRISSSTVLMIGLILAKLPVDLEMPKALLTNFLISAKGEGVSEQGGRCILPSVPSSPCRRFAAQGYLMYEQATRF